MPWISKRELAQLQESRKVLEMKTCKFSLPQPENRVLRVYVDRDGIRTKGWPETSEPFTEDVKEALRDWLRTWVLPAIDEILNKERS